MRIAIVGLGAVGGLVAARLSLAGAQVSALARGRTLEAVARDGLRLLETRSPDDTRSEHLVRLRVEPEAAALGEQDAVVIALKAPALAQVAPTLAPLIGPATTIVPAMNGVPWWFFHALPGLDPERRRQCTAAVDPDGAVAAALPPQHVVGCVVHLGCSTPQPGIVRRNNGNRLVLGEPGGVVSERARTLADWFARAGFDVDLSARIEHEAWYKLWGNLSMNPVSAFTGATLDQILADPLVRGFVNATMGEAAAVGARIGLPIGQTPEERHRITDLLGAFRTSMLQDVDAGRPIELDALVGSVAGIARAVDVATPNIDALLGLTRLFARVHGLYPAAH